MGPAEGDDEASTGTVSPESPHSCPRVPVLLPGCYSLPPAVIAPSLPPSRQQHGTGLEEQVWADPDVAVRA